MAFTTGKDLTAAPSFTTGTTFTVSSGQKITVPLTFANYESFTLTAGIQFTNYESLTVTVPITFDVVFALNIPISFSVYETLTLSAGITFVNRETFTLTVPTSFTTFETYVRTVPLTFVNRETFTLTVPISVHVYWQLVVPLTFTQYETFALAVPVTFGTYESFNLSAGISFETYGNNWAIGIPLAFVNFETLTITAPISIDVTENRYSLSVPLTFVNRQTLTITAGLRFEVLPLIASGTGGQGIGQVIVVPSDYAQHWGLRVTLGGADVSSRVVGSVTVDAEETSAVVAVFSLRAQGGYIDPYSWARQPVTIEYIAKDFDGSTLYSSLIFKGIVDTPEYNTQTRVTQFNCTDNLQNIVQGMQRSVIDQLTPLAKWSRFVFDENSNGWEYLQQRLGTYNYTAGLDINGQLLIKDWRAGAIRYEFNSSTILDESLKVTLANARDMVNSVTVSMASSTEVFRESIISLRWSESAWFENSYLDWFPCTVQMICDAVANAGAAFADIPQFNMTPQSQWRQGPNNSTYGFLNPGTDLTCIEFSGKISKRWKQSVNHTSRIVVQSTDSISAVGPLRESLDGSITSQYNGTIEEFFTKTQPVNWFQNTAGTGLSYGAPNSDIPIGTPLMFQGDGFVSYPMLGYSFQTYHSYQSTLSSRYGLSTLKAAYEAYYNMSKVSSIPMTISAYQVYQDAMEYVARINNPINLALYDHTMIPTQPGQYSSVFDITGPVGGHGQPGEHVYNFDNFLIQGNQADRQGVFDILKAQGETKILASHRQNRVGFDVLVNPQLKRGDTLRVSTSTVRATGVVHQLTHTFDIDGGTAKTSVSLAISTPKSIGIAAGQISGIVIRVPITFEVGVALTPAGASRVPVTFGAIVHDVALPSHYYSSGEPNPDWQGHISPRRYAGRNEFVVTFPRIPVTDTENSTVVTEQPAVNVPVPQDEFLLLA